MPVLTNAVTVRRTHRSPGAVSPRCKGSAKAQRRGGPKNESALVVRESAAGVTELALLAKGRHSVIWLQDTEEVDPADWALFKELK